MKHTITLIPGDGIGPEVAANVVRIIEAAGVEVNLGNSLRGRAGAGKIWRNAASGTA